MRQILLLFVFIALALLSAALLSWPIFRLLHIFADVSLHKVISLSSSLCSLFFIFLYLKFYNTLDRTTAGFRLVQSSLTVEIGTGIAAGMMIMLVLETVLLLLGIHQWEPGLNISLKFVTTILLKAAFAGVMVALIEETLYRGALLGGLLKTTGVTSAVIVSSMIYAAVHFIDFPQLPANADNRWTSGLLLLAGAFPRFSDPAIIDSLLALFAFGVLLALVRLHKGNIFQCMGLHAGVVAAIKLIKALTDYVPGNDLAYLVNRYDHRLGYLALIWLVVLIIAYYRYTFKRPTICKSNA